MKSYCSVLAGNNNVDGVISSNQQCPLSLYFGNKAVYPSLTGWRGIPHQHQDRTTAEGRANEEEPLFFKVP